MKRRQFIRSGSVLGTAAIVPYKDQFQFNPQPIRIAHLTDMHVKPEQEIISQVTRAVHHAQNQVPGADFIINGGDAIMDSLNANRQETAAQWNALIQILKNDVSLPAYHCIGNHDIWGWFLKENRPEKEKQYGKQWALESLHMPGRYYSFRKGNWHFIVLDSTQLNPAGGYIGKLDEEQLTWLQHELNTVNRENHICIISHIPILSICAGLFFDRTEPNGDLKIQRNLMHSDFITLKKLFGGFPNIRVCISGHIHLQDEVNYLGIKYYCNGAVSGNWWKGKFQEFEPAYAIIELFEDGSSKRKMIPYSS